MITKESENEKLCLICASDYHLEMILLPYIKNRLSISKFVIFTENDLEESLNTLLTRVNLNDSVKKQIKNLNWKNIDKMDFLKDAITKEKELNIIINGSNNYIEYINNKIKSLLNNNVKIIDCFHVSDSEIDIKVIKQKYKYILNTEKI